MAKKYVGFSGVFCPHCGERVEKGETICPSCKKTYSLDDCFKGVSALGAAGKGWTENADDISLKRFAKKNLKGSVIGMFVVSVIIAAVIWFTSGMNMDRFEKEWYVVVGPLIIIWVFWLIWLIMQFGKSKSWEGTVTEKERKEYKSASRDEDGHKHVETTVFYILHFKDTKGKNRKLTQRSTTGWYEYLKEGDRIRYHGKHTSYYEKYDKSADEEIPCAGCGKSCDARAAYCDRCGCILFKAPSFCTACGAATDEKESKAKEALSSKTEKTPYADLIKKTNNSKEKKETSEKKREKKKEKEEQVEEGAMKAFKRSFFPAYLFAALFFLYAGEELFCSSAMIRSGRFLTDSEVISAGRKGIIVFAILAVLSGICVSYERKRIDKAAGRTLKAIMQLLFAAGFTYTCVGYFMKDGNVSGNMAWVITSAAAAFISLLTVVLCLYSAVADNSVWDEPKGFLKNFFYAVRSPLSLLLWMIFCLIVFALPMICTLLVSNLSRITEITFALKMGMYITAEAVEAGLICLLYMSLEKNIKKRKAGLDSKKSRDEEKEERKKGVRFSDIISLCMGAFGLVCLIPICFPKTGKAADRIFNDIDNILAESSIKVYEADLSGAFVYADEAWYMTEAYKAYLKGDSYALEQMTRTRPDSEVVWALYTDLTGNIKALEEHMMYDEVQNKNIENVLLNAYCTGDAARLSDDEKEYKKALLKDRMNLGIFTYDIPIPEKKQEASNSGKDGNDPDALNTLEKKYVSVSGYRDALRQLVNLSAFGVENNDVVRKVIDLAEKYPDDASLLFLAGAVGAEAASDNAWHYSTCIEKLKKFAELVLKDSTLKDDDKSNRLFSAAKLMSVMRGYEDALTVLKTIDELKISDRNNDTKMLKLLCYDRLNDGENCYMTAKDLYAGGNTGFQVLYYYAVGAIKKGDRVESIKALEAYADKLLKTETSDNDFIPAQAQFHVLVSYATVSKNNAWVKYGFEFYHDLSDEEKNALSPFLHNYMEMLSEYYWYGDVEKSASAAAEVLKKRNDLVYAYYMQGIQNYDTGKYEDSRDAYLKANELYPDNPTILYGLAYAYDALKEYEAAFEASERCKLLVPAVDHEEDWYGLGYHNLNLYYALKQHLESEVSE